MPQVHGVDPSTGAPNAVQATDGALHVLPQGSIGGSRNNGSSTNNYAAVKQECNMTRVIGTSETLISNVPVFLLGIIANNGATPSSGYVSLRDAAATGGGSTPKSEPRATGGDDPDFKAARFEIGLTSQGSAAATDVTLLWRPIS